MSKRTVLAFFAAIVIALGLVGCGGSGTSSSQSSQSGQSGQSASSASSEASQQSSAAIAAAENPDAEFLPELAAALEARWALAEQMGDQELTPQLRAQLVNAELEHLAAFKGASFQDAGLGEAAERYIATLEESLASLDSYDTNYTDFAKRWSDSYKERVIAIKDLVEQFGLKVAGEYQESLDSVLKDAEKTAAELQVPEDIRQAADEEIPAAAVSAFQKADGNTYRATVVNPSRASFDYYNLDVYLLDDKGGLVEQHLLTLENWASGTEAVFEFTADTEFKTIGALSNEWYGTWPN